MAVIFTRSRGYCIIYRPELDFRFRSVKLYQNKQNAQRLFNMLIT